MKTSIYCLIPARGGSKRIPKKNIKNFCDLPIIAWSIKSALESKVFDKVIVSTDDKEISEISKSYGAEVPFKRPKELADDHSTTLDVINHFISYLNNNDISNNPIIFCLYPTAPFIRSNHIQFALSNYQKTNGEFILFASKEYEHPIERSFHINKQGLSVLNFPNTENIRTQDLNPTFHDAGQFYIGSVNCWTSTKNIINNNYPLIIPNLITYDIDYPKDWDYAEKLFKSFYQNN